MAQESKLKEMQALSKRAMERKKKYSMNKTSMDSGEENENFNILKESIYKKIAEMV